MDKIYPPQTLEEMAAHAAIYSKESPKRSEMGDEIKKYYDLGIVFKNNYAKMEESIEIVVDKIKRYLQSASRPSNEITELTNRIRSEYQVANRSYSKLNEMADNYPKIIKVLTYPIEMAKNQFKIMKDQIKDAKLGNLVGLEPE
jgi:hypothetical protein